MTPRDVYVLLAELVVGYVFWPYRWAKRWHLRLKLRRKMRALGMIPAVAVLWCGWELAPIAKAVAQSPSDSLIGTALSRAKIGAWNGGQPVTIYCLTWVTEIPTRPHVLVIVDAEPADLSKDPICPNPSGGFYPFWVDGTKCPPGQVNPFPERAFIIVRCGPDDISRYKNEVPPPQKQGR